MQKKSGNFYNRTIRLITGAIYRNEKPARLSPGGLISISLRRPYDQQLELEAAVDFSPEHVIVVISLSANYVADTTTG